MNVKSAILALLLSSGFAFAQPPQVLNMFTPQPVQVQQASATYTGQVFTGSQPIFYFVVGCYATGCTPAFGPISVVGTPGLQGLNSSRFVTITWQAVSGMTSYTVLRSSTAAFPSSCADCAVVISTTATSVVDNGSSLSAFPFSGYSLVGSSSGSFRIDNTSSSTPQILVTLNGSSSALGSGGGSSSFYQTFLNNSSAVTQRDQFNLIPGTGISISSSDSTSPSRTSFTINATGGGTGDVVGPASATNNAIALYNGTTGKSIKDSATLLPTGLLVGSGQANTYSTGVQDFGAATSLKIPTSAGAAPTANGLVAYDSTANRYRFGQNGGTALMAQLGAGTPANNDCVKFDVNGNLVSNGAACATAGTTVTAASPYATIGGSLFGPIFTVTNPGTPSWAWNNQNLATLTVTNNAQTLCAPPSGISVNSRLVSTPGTPWTVTAQFIFNVVNATTPRMGIALRESGTGKMITSGAATVSEFYVDNWNSSTSFASTAVTSNLGASAGFKFVRATDNGTNITFSYSYDGIGWHVYYDFARTNFFTTAPDQFGFFIFNNSAALNVCSTLISWSVT